MKVRPWKKAVFSTAYGLRQEEWRRYYEDGREAAVVTPVAMVAFTSGSAGYYLHRLNRDGLPRRWPVTWVPLEDRKPRGPGHLLGDCEEQRAELDQALADAGHELQ